ncbi:MAG TPA: fructosamine kinase family protein [Chitinophagaceae bacterium]|jgi:fructosamine-3-kinase|nr:fructosamine kinase family protein [Chitinophagaceae bacterium]
MVSQQISVAISEILRLHSGIAVDLVSMQPLGGGSINDTYQATVNGRLQFFLKVNTRHQSSLLLQKEKEGLEFLSQQQIIRTPEIIACEEVNGQQWLLLEWIESGERSPEFWKSFGRQLAALHHITQSGFGFTSNNFMGALPQDNQRTDTWLSFFVQRRLQPQLTLALQNGLVTTGMIKSFGLLYKKLDTLFEEEPPALLHGDLWSGNFLCDKTGNPVLIDPAVYFGHRSMDLAMTTLFGGFDPLFYESYHYHFPFPYHYREQWEICNLYPLLIHLNLFGSSYRMSIEAILKKFAG